MNIQEIRKLHLADPFRPFYVHLRSGRKLLVKHPGNMGYSPSGKAMAIYTRPEVAESLCADDIITVRQAKAAFKKNGRSRT